jgi:E3 ubiquitin-protein ligase MARCH6
MEIAHEPPPSLDGTPIPANTIANSPSSSYPSSSASSPRVSKGKEIMETSTSTAPPSAKYDDDDEDEEDVCRICRNPGDADNPLRYPCACSGSIKFVHQDCLLQWLNHSNARQCEVNFLSS